ncbi:hypothetical protein DJ018_16030 [Phenylobacterium deserti]|uniref:DUF2268 domain-containing protein n=2 Tax=Phenylobacterium deserti TaxID=1914756 RepID=A0A328ADG0_9CAUL|nr:hypothetical protein DJ018_16030 [Phenylobacterium deserti]
MRGIIVLAFALLAFAGQAQAAGLEVRIDSRAAHAVLAAVRNENLTTAQALEIARLPGNQGLIRKALGYGRPADETIFAQALMAAAHRQAGAPDPGVFRFDRLRDNAEPVAKALADLEDPAQGLLERGKADMAPFVPAEATGQVTGYLVVGGTSGGFAFGEPAFYLNMERVPSARLAATILIHELFHAVQTQAQAGRASTAEGKACAVRREQSPAMSDLFTALAMEGVASRVADLIALPDTVDPATDEERRRMLRNVRMVGRSITQLELSVHGLATGAKVSYQDIYELGFYGDEVLYALGYVMAKAIAAEQGAGALADLTGRPGAAFVARYVGLKSYGGEDAPRLGEETVSWARRLWPCTGA